jgi:high-affinity iron transporter
MLPSFLLALREGVEAALIVGLLAGVLRRIRRLDCMPSLWLGVATGATISVIAALFVRALGLRFAGDAEAIYEGVVGLAAAALLTGMIFWMRCHAGREGDAAEVNVRAAVRSGRGAVFSLAFVAVVREGIELALFLNAAIFRSAASDIVAGAMLGLLVAVAGGRILFACALRFSVRRFFQVSGAVLLLLASGFVFHAVGEFIEVKWIPPLIEPVWNTSGWLPETSPAGAVLETLFGYKSAPSFTEVSVYALFLIAVGWALRYARVASEPPGKSIIVGSASRETTQGRSPQETSPGAFERRRQGGSIR